MKRIHSPGRHELPIVGSRQRLRALAERGYRVLPRGRLLPDAMWNRRHRVLVVVLWLHVAGLTLFGAMQGFSVLDLVAGAGVLSATGALASLPRLGRQWRSVLASLGLILSSTLLVRYGHGQAETHFHFFVVLSLLTLYQDWTPFLLAVVAVVVHHGIVGQLVPAAVYDDPNASAHPWQWTLLHGTFAVAASLANLAAWRANEQLLRDGLTRLPTRMFFLDRVASTLAEARSSGSPMAVLFLDLDRFKVINDSLGHRAGDRLLVEVARRLQAGMRPYDTAARFGGDEFAVLCPDVSDEAHARSIADRLAAMIAEPLNTEDGVLFSTVSIGITLPDASHEDAEAVLRDADAAMYQAKRAGGNGCAVFDAHMRASAVERMATESALRCALERGEVRVHYQLEADLHTGAFVGLEALMRWEHPERGLVPPDRFIGLAEETGLIVPLGAWLLEETCRQAQEWRRAGKPIGHLGLRVNISAAQFVQPDLVDLVRDVLERTDTEPAQLCLEITESVVMDDTEQTLTVLSELRALGVTLAIDDFGTGYSSLTYLRRFPVDALKIDRSFVCGLGEDPHASAIVAAVVSMSHALGLTVVAEGVESPKHLAELRRLGCDAGQGYWLARPHSAEVVEAVIEGPPPLFEYPSAPSFAALFSH